MKYLSVLTIFSLLLICGCNQKKPGNKSGALEKANTEKIKEIEKVVTKLDGAQKEIDASAKELESLLNDLD